MIRRNQLVMQILDLHRVILLTFWKNLEFQANDLEKKKELTVHYVTSLFKKEFDDNLDSFVEHKRTDGFSFDSVSNL